MLSLDRLLAILDLEQLDTDRFRSASAEEHGESTVYGGQLLAQSVVAAAADQDGKAVKTLHTVFARAALPDQPLELHLDRIHAGKGFASTTVTIRQGDRLCARSQVLLSAQDPELIRHADRPAGEPLMAPAGPPGSDWQVRIVGDVDVSDPDAVGPPELDVWTCFPDAPADVVTSQALLAFVSDFFLIGAAMRPHPGVGQSQAHVTVATGVISHTLTYHEPLSAAEWLLMSHRSPYAGHGRGYGRADVFREDGQLVASFVQDSMIRPMGART